MSTCPLTERVLRRLPGSRIVWMVVWALCAPLRPVALLAVLAATGETRRVADVAGVFASQGIFGYVVLVLLWGIPRLVARVDALTLSLSRIAPSVDEAHPFPRLTSSRGPTILAVATVAIATPSTAADFGVAVALVDVPLLFVTILPIMTFVWTYGVVLTGLHRLGRSRLELDVFPQDRALGLGPVGGAALSGFWILMASAVPVLILTGQDLTTFGISVAVVTVIVLLFVLSMVRLHGQMQVAKAHYVSMTHALVADAYRPVGTSTDLTTLVANAPALNAAQSLAERADRILEWPIDERMVALMTVVLTGVVTSLIVRLVLVAVGI